MAVPPTWSWMSRATMPLVSVTMAWAIEIPGVRTPPTVVKAPNFKTSLRDSGLCMDLPFVAGTGDNSPCRIVRRDSTVDRTTNEAPRFRVQGDEPPGGGRGHLCPGGPAAAAALRRLPLGLGAYHQDRSPVRSLHGPRHRLPGVCRLPAAGRPDRPPGDHREGAGLRGPGGAGRSRGGGARAGPRPGRRDWPAGGRLPPDAGGPPGLDATARGPRLQARYPQRA